KGAEQIGALGIIGRRTGFCRLRLKSVKALFRWRVSRVARGDHGRCLGAVDPGLRSGRPVPAFERCGEIHLAPFWVTRLGEERVELAEEGIDEARHALIALAVFVPIER